MIFNNGDDQCGFSLEKSGFVHTNVEFKKLMIQHKLLSNKKNYKFIILLFSRQKKLR